MQRWERRRWGETAVVVGGSSGGGRQRWGKEAALIEGGSGGGGRPQWGEKHCCGGRGDAGGSQQRRNSAGLQTVTTAVVAAVATWRSWDTAQLREAWAQCRQERPPSTGASGPPLTARQIHCTRKIDTDTGQSSESRVGADTVQSSGLRLYASFSAYNCSVSFLAE